MAISPSIREKACQFFIQEAPELLQTIEQELLTLGQQRTPQKVHNLMRAAHSIKGGAANVGLQTICDIAHRLEDSFRALHNQEIVIDGEMEDLLLQGYDCLRIPLMDVVTRGKFNKTAAMRAAEPVLERLEARISGFGPVELPTAAELGVDMTRSIFEVDVAQGLTRMRAIVADRSHPELAGEVRAQAEVFVGLADLLELPGFGEIASLTLQALDRHPRQAYMIAQVALEDLDRAFDAVMAGDRTRGGEPSRELMLCADLIPPQAITIAPVVPAAPEPTPVIAEELAATVVEAIAVSEPIALVAEEPPAPQAIVEEPSIAEPVSEIIEDALSAELISQATENIPIAELVAETTEHASIAELVSDEADSASAVEAVLEVIKQGPAATIEYVLPTRKISVVTEGLFIAPVEKISVEELVSEISEEIPTAEISPVIPTASSANEVVAEVINEFSIIEPIASASEESPVPEEAIFIAETTSIAEPIAIIAEEPLALEPIAETIEELPVVEPSAVVLEVIPVEELIAVVSEEIQVVEPISTLVEEIQPVEPISTLAEEIQSVESVAEIAEEIQTVEPITEVSPIAEVKPAEIVSSVDEDLEEILGSEPNPVVANEAPVAKPVSIAPEVAKLPETVPVIIEETLTLEPIVAPAKVVKPSEPIAAPINVVKPPEPVAPVKPVSAVRLETPTPVIAPVPPAQPPATINVVSQPQTKPLPPVPQPGTKLATNAPKAIESPVPVLDALKEEESEEEQMGTGEESGAARPSVRVDLDRLERLNNQVGELAIAQNGQALQNERLQSTVEQLIERLAKFRKVGAELQGLSDQMLTSPQGNARQVSAFDASFDALELDQYSQLNLLLQSASDEMALIEESAGDIAIFAGLSNQSLERQRRMLKNLRDDLMWARMLPLSEILDGFPRALRELSRTYRKPVDLRIAGGHVLVDKAALEKLHDPLLHLVRNAFDHGLELPFERQSSGKPEVGRIEIRAYHQGGRTVIEVRDDGRGIHYDHIRRKAVERGWLSKEQAEAASKPQLLDLLFEPGFSTAAQTTDLSGRGVGLDVVRSQLTALKGTITITSEPGRGTTFSLFIPLTLTVAKLMICIAGGTAYALPSEGIETILVPKADQVSESRGQRLLQWRRRLVPMRKLSELLPYNRPVPELEGRDALAAIPLPADWARPVLLLRLKSQVLAVEIDQVVTEQELVIKPIGSAIAAPGYIYGCTILGDGSVVPVIDGSELLARVLNTGTGEMKVAEVSAATTRKALPSVRSVTQTVLIVDDSQSMRQTLELTFETAGYRVLVARDGREGIEQMQKHPEISLTICDVEMPNMNGFELLDRRRQDRSIASIPIVMLTSRTGEKHRKMAMHLGATDFISKPQVESELVALVAKYGTTEKSTQTAAT